MPVWLLWLPIALAAQSQQEGSRPGWPCVAGRAVDPSYIEVAESSGGSIFLFQKNEIEHTGSFMSATFTHPATIFRAIGSIAGSREWEFPVDSTVRSIYVAVSMQCRQSIAVFDPRGAETTAGNAKMSRDLQTGKLVQVDQPGTGNWRVRISGQGLFVLLVYAATDIRFAHAKQTEEDPKRIQVYVAGPISDPKFSLLNAAGDKLASLTAEKTETGFTLAVAQLPERFRVIVEGADETGNPVRRVYPTLFRAK
jgi:hypothetical protein